MTSIISNYPDLSETHLSSLDDASTKRTAMLASLSIPSVPTYPTVRPRRLRISPAIRQMVRETYLHPEDFIYPLFVRHGEGVRRPIPSMPGQYQLSIDTLVEEAERAWELGIRAVILFGIPAHKDPLGSENYDPHGIVPQAIRTLKRVLPEMVVISDICMCEYTDHGHCGIINTPEIVDFNPRLPQGYVLNDPTLDYIGRTAVVHVQAGADMVAPSGMMDGMVGAIRSALDRAGLEHIPIMSYAAKYASALYGPFRDAAESPPTFGDRSQYQMDPANAREAMREVLLDIAEGADIIMVKPASFYLDILAQLKELTRLPLAAYQVSGEYAMIKAAAANGWIDETRVMLESLLSIKRAGADMILTYFAMDAAEVLSRS